MTAAPTTTAGRRPRLVPGVDPIRDDVLAVPCPVARCKAPAGVPCSVVSFPGYHIRRADEAFRREFPNLDAARGGDEWPKADPLHRPGRRGPWAGRRRG